MCGPIEGLTEVLELVPRRRGTGLAHRSRRLGRSRARDMEFGGKEL